MCSEIDMMEGYAVSHMIVPFCTLGITMSCVEDGGELTSGVILVVVVLQPTRNNNRIARNLGAMFFMHF